MMGAIKELTVGRTLLLITHRLVDLHWMDEIVVLDGGRVAARGTHADLLKSNKQYAALHQRIPCE